MKLQALTALIILIHLLEIFLLVLPVILARHSTNNLTQLDSAFLVPGRVLFITTTLTSLSMATGSLYLTYLEFTTLNINIMRHLLTLTSSVSLTASYLSIAVITTVVLRGEDGTN